MTKFEIEKYIPHLSIDCVIFGYQDKELKVLISQLKFGEADWALPGGYILLKEGIDTAASRILKERTRLENIYLEQFRVFGNENRITNDDFKTVMKAEFEKYDVDYFTPDVIDWLTGRFVCIGYYALVDINKVNPKPGVFEQTLEWINLKEIPKLTYDHNEILQNALDALRQNFERKLNAFNLLPETFTIQELHALYEVIYDKPIVISNFQKRILDLNVLDRLEKKFTGAQHKAPYLYRFKNC